MATTTITSTLLNGMRNSLTGMIRQGRYKINGTWYTAALNSAEVQPNGAVHVTFYIDRQSGNDPATAFQLLDKSGQTLVERSEEVPFTQYVDRILIRFKLGVSAGTN